MLPALEVICVGKYKNKNFEELEHHYLKQIKKLKLTELKSFAENVSKEEQELEIIFSKYDASQIYLLTEKGITFKDSIHFSSFIEKESQKIQKPLVFVISGAMGFSEKMKEKYKAISLSPLTLPHKLCRLVLIEQIYRSQTILSGHPYHN